MYTNALAQKNGFQLLGNTNNINLKNPNLVFPGEFLKLPDDRLTRIKSGQYIWEISKTHYKKDTARLKILARQIKKISSKKSNDESKLKVTRLKSIMERLAVTPGMKLILSKL